MPSGKQVLETGREALVSLTSMVGSTATNILKKFSNPVVASRTYRYLSRQISQDMVGIEEGKTIVFSSLTSLEVNSEILLMLAYFLQDELNVKVLVVDATLRGNGVTKLLNQGARQGVMEILAGKGQLTVADTVTPLVGGKVSFMGAGDIANNPMAHFTENQVRNFFAALKQDYDYVILQQDYIQEDTRYLLFARCANMIIMHLEERSTPIAKFEDAKNVFREHRITNVKYILSEP